MAKFIKVYLDKIIIPQDIISVPSKKRTEHLKTALESSKTSDILFCIVTETTSKKFTLIDRYDVYIAAVENGLHKINCLVLDKQDTIKGHITITNRPFVNPVTILRMIKPFVDDSSIEDAVKLFHLDSAYIRMYERFPPRHCIKRFEKLIDMAYENGAQSIVPLIMFERLKDSDKDMAMVILDGVESMISATKSRFRWPDKAIIRGMTPTTDEPRPEKPIKTDIRELECEHCQAEYIITPDTVLPKQEEDGVLLLEGEDLSEPYFVPTKYNKYLNCTKENPPNIILSKDINGWKDLQRRVGNKKYMVLVDGS